MTTNKETFLKFFDDAKIRPEDRAALDRLDTKLSCLVLTEDWCGDALYNFPVLAKLVHGHPRVEMRIFLRDRNPDLMDQYLNQGIYRSIPVFAFFDESMNELARFIERRPPRRRRSRRKCWRSGVRFAPSATSSGARAP